MLYPIFPRQVPSRESTVFWDGFLSNEEINLILSQPEWCFGEPAKIGGSGNAQIDSEKRTSNVSWLDTKPELIQIWDKFSRVAAEVNSKYFQFDLSGFHEPMQLGIYSEYDNGHYSWHTDAAPFDRNVPRKLSMSLLLSDPSEFEGGDLQVKTVSDDPVTLECSRGRAWFFPSYTLHRVTPVTKGIRRSLVLWIGGPPFR